MAAVHTALLTLRLKFSANPFACGCRRVMGLCSIPINLQQLLNASESKGGPLSLFILTGIPNEEIILSSFGSVV